MCQGTIRQDCKDGSYLVEDSVSDLEQINRADIITDADDTANQIGLHDPVIAPHPSFPYAYAPGRKRRSGNPPYTFFFWMASLPIGFKCLRRQKKEIFDTAGEFKSPFLDLVSLQNLKETLVHCKLISIGNCSFPLENPCCCHCLHFAGN